MTNDPRALIIVINFQHAECTLRFLRSVARLDGFATCHLIVVDNDSDDGSAARIRQAISSFRNVEVLPSSRNRGYFGGARWALDRYLAQHAYPDWVIVCNNDIEFTGSSFLQKLLEKDAAANGVLAPTIVSGLTGHDANPSIRRRPNRFAMLRYRLWLSTYYSMWFKQWLSPFVRRARFRFSNRTPAAAEAVRRPIYAPHGSFLIFSRKFFESGGFLDDGSFLYSEEFRVAEMCLRLRLPVIHDPQLRVAHAEGQSTGRILSRAIYRHQKNGFLYALARYNKSYPELSPAPSSLHTTARDPRDSQFISTAEDIVR